MQEFSTDIHGSGKFCITLNSKSILASSDKPNFYRNDAEAINEIFYKTIPALTYSTLIEVMLENVQIDKERFLDLVHKVYNKKYQ